MLVSRLLHTIAVILLASAVSWSSRAVMYRSCRLSLSNCAYSLSHDGGLYMLEDQEKLEESFSGRLLSEPDREKSEQST